MRNIRAIVIVVSLAVALSLPMVVQAQLTEGASSGKLFGNPWIDVRTNLATVSATSMGK